MLQYGLVRGGVQNRKIKEEGDGWRGRARDVEDQEDQRRLEEPGAAQANVKDCLPTNSSNNLRSELLFFVPFFFINLGLP